MVQRDGSRKARVTGGRFTEAAASWAPNLQRMVVSRYRADRRNFELLILKTDGNVVRHLTRTNGSERDPVWSPDGDWIAFERRGRVFLIRPDGTGQRRLTPAGVRESDPTWSPTARRIALVSDRRSPDDPTLLVIDRKGRAIARVSDLAARARLDWSSRGWIAYSYGNGTGVFVLRPSGKHRHRVGWRLDSHPAWSPNGSKMLVWNSDGVWKMHRDGSDRVHIAEGMPLDWTR